MKNSFLVRKKLDFFIKKFEYASYFVPNKNMAFTLIVAPICI